MRTQKVNCQLKNATLNICKYLQMCQYWQLSASNLEQ